jgi:hypothetical protein
MLHVRIRGSFRLLRFGLAYPLSNIKHVRNKIQFLYVSPLPTKLPLLMRLIMWEICHLKCNLLQYCSVKDYVKSM